MSKTIAVKNPCYHCYAGAIGECALTACKCAGLPWSGDVERAEIEYELQEIAEEAKEQMRELVDYRSTELF